MNSYQGKTVLIAGGTRGIGLASGIEFAKRGAKVWVTHRWGSVSDAEVEGKFAQSGAKTKPRIFQADVINDEDTEVLIRAMHSEVDSVDVFIASASSLKRIQSLEDYKKRSFLKTIEYSAWPIAAYPLKIHEIFGKFPRYIVGVSTFSTQMFHANYDFGATGKAALETLVKYLAVRLQPFGSTINIIRPPAVKTEALNQVFGKARADLLQKIAPSPGLTMKPEEVAQSVFGLCSGYFDHLSGQTLNLDQGGAFLDSSMGVLEREDLRQALADYFGLPSED